MTSTIQIRAFDRNTATTPRTALSVGNKKNKIIFKKPNVSSKQTRGKTNTVQMLVKGLIV
jgi:hypothetical protein